MKMGIRSARFAVLTTAGAVLLSFLYITTTARKNTSSSRENSTAPLLSTGVDTPRWEKAYAQLPMGFEENRGQAARDVKFVSHGSGYALSLAPQEVDIALLRRRAMTASPLHRRGRAARASRGAQSDEDHGDSHATAGRKSRAGDRSERAAAWAVQLFHRQQSRQMGHRRSVVWTCEIFRNLPRRGCGVLRQPATFRI